MTGHDPMCPVDPPRMDDGFCIWCEVIAKVRADEGKRNAIAEVERAWAERADLRAKVEALEMFTFTLTDYREIHVVIRADVLALFGGSDD